MTFVYSIIAFLFFPTIEVSARIAIAINRIVVSSFKNIEIRYGILHFPLIMKAFNIISEHLLLCEKEFDSQIQQEHEGVPNSDQNQPYFHVKPGITSLILTENTCTDS